MKFFLISILLYCLPISNVNGQKRYEPDKHRQINIIEKDRAIQALVITPKKVKAKTDRIYYWYDNNIIIHTQGGYSKYLLDGIYTEFYYPERSMQTQGMFKYGLKDGIWKSWYPNGSLRDITNWKNGRKNGTTIYYTQNAEVSKKEQYNKGKIVIADKPKVDSLQHHVKKPGITGHIKKFGRGIRSIFKTKSKK